MANHQAYGLVCLAPGTIFPGNRSGTSNPGTGDHEKENNE
jgi:hypothetical protein